MDWNLYHNFPENLAAEWNDLLPHSVSNVPFMRYDYLKTWWQTRGGGEWEQAELMIAVARQDGKLVGAAPLFFTSNYNGNPSLLLVGSIEVSDYLDFLVRPQDLAVFLNELFDFLKSGCLPLWKNLELYDILDSSPTLPALEEASRLKGWKHTQERFRPCPYINLPGSWESYLAGVDKKQRHEIRRKMRRLEEAEISSRWYIVNDQNDLEAEIEEFLELMHQDSDKMQFLTQTMQDHMRNTARWAQAEGILHLAFLEIDGRKAAAKLCFDYGNCIWGYNSGVDRRYMDYSPGWVLLGNMLKWSNEHGYSVFDFMRGDEEYKYRFGGINRYVMYASIQTGDEK